MADARDWYEDQQIGLGEAFLRRVGETFDRIGLMPQSHRVIYQGVRRALIRRFPFAVDDRVDGEDVVVLGVVHSRRDPRTWKNRA